MRFFLANFLKIKSNRQEMAWLSTGLLHVKIFRTAVYTILMLIGCSSVQVWAQKPIRMGPAPEEEIKKARTALDPDMNNIKAHKTYIYAMGLINPLLVDQYKGWMKAYPENVNIPLTIGTVFYNAEMPEAKDFLLRAAEMDPQNAKVWLMLSEDANRRGENDLSTEYIRKAALSDSSNVSYQMGYLMSFLNSHPDDYEQKVFDFVKRFPEKEQGAQALYWLALRTRDLNARINYLETLRKLYSPQQFNWSSSGMAALADIYLQTDLEKARLLMNEMEEKGDWKIRKQVAESLMRMKKMEQDQNYKGALTELDHVKLPRHHYMNNFMILKKSALLKKSGDVKAAYDSLVMAFATLPTDELYTALERYGSETGKNKAQVDKDIETIRNSTAVPAYPFDLGLYTSNGKLHLNSLKGKVVLLTFWFPGCGPCKAEFPHFEAVIEKFKGQNVVYVGINVFPEQDPYVIPFMENNKYSFIPLRGTPEFADKYYGVKSEPENFLIDQAGKIVFKNFRTDNTNHRTLELMIASLLQKGDTKAK